MTYKFIREPESGLITVVALIDGEHRLKLILDTGASYTTIDSNMLYLTGYDIMDNVGSVLVETASGIIETELFDLEELQVFGITKSNFRIQVYDFVAHGIVSDYNGLLGLDFFEGTKFCLDLDNHDISIQVKN